MEGEIKTIEQAIRYDPNQYIRNCRGIKEVLQVIVKPDKTYSKPEVVVLYGPTGVGKDRLAIQGADDQKMEWFRKSAGMGKWWDGYNGEPYIILSDFDGGEHFPYKLFLDLIDGYGTLQQTKGGAVWIKPKKWVITTEHHPSLWWDYAKVGSYEQLKRRITSIQHIPEALNFESGSPVEPTEPEAN